MTIIVKRYLPLFSVFLLPNMLQHNRFFTNCQLHPAFGDSLIGAIQEYDTTGVPPGVSGANIAWDYSALTLTNSIPLYHYYFDPSQTSGFSTFPSSTVADSSSDGYFSYYNHAFDSVSFLGKYALNNEMYYAWDPEVKMSCDLNFGSSFSDFYSWYNIGSVCMIYHTYTNRSVTYDAYGTLVLFKVTYPNVARLKIVETTIDTMLCPPNAVPESSIDTTYLWIDMNTNEPVMKWQYHKDIINNVTAKYVHVYSYDHIPAMVLTSAQNIEGVNPDINVYPNPSSGGIFIGSIDNASLDVFNSTGERIMVTVNKIQNQLHADFSSQPEGIYFLHLRNEKESICKKLILKK